LGRRSVARAVSVGCFWALLPLPIQTPLGLLTAIFFRANLPVTVVAVWISNPLTMVPLYGTGFFIDAYLTATPLVPLDELTLTWFEPRLPKLWAGCLLMSILGQLLSYYLVNTLWRFTVLPDRRNRNRSARFNFNSLTGPGQDSQAVI
jgi:hypothetical protein